MSTQELLDLSLKIGTALVSVLAAIYAWWSNHRKTSTAEIKQVENKIVDLDRKIYGKFDTLAAEENGYRGELRRTLDSQSTRLTLLEEAVRNTPKSADMMQLRETISKLEVSVSRLAGAQDEQARMLSTLHEFLLRMGRN